MSLEAIEKLFITEMLQRRSGNRNLAANDLSISVSTPHRKINAYGIDALDADGRGHRR